MGQKTQVYLGICRYIQVYLGRFSQIQVDLGIFRHIQIYLGIFSNLHGVSYPATKQLLAPATGQKPSPKLPKSNLLDLQFQLPGKVSKMKFTGPVTPTIRKRFPKPNSLALRPLLPGKGFQNQIDWPCDPHVQGNAFQNEIS